MRVRLFMVLLGLLAFRGAGPVAARPRPLGHRVWSQYVRRLLMAQLDVAGEVWTTLRGWGSSAAAIAGILGNMQAESALIADRWQSEYLVDQGAGKP